jgi:nucleoid-associated protein YgaU
MPVIPFKALLFLAGGCTVAAATAYVSDVLRPYLVGPSAVLMSLPEPSALNLDPTIASSPGQEATVTVQPESAPGAPPETLLPSFDLIRVESDGSVVIAGKAPPNARVEIDAGARVIGNTVAGPEGDFAIVVDEPLRPGGYQLKLRSTTQDNVVAISLEAAVVYIPAKLDGQVLALVEKPGEPSKLITIPAALSSAPAVAPVGQLKTTDAPASSEPVLTAPTGAAKVALDAMEIEGRNIFLAGTADPGRKVRAYANDIPLGETDVLPGGSFLIEAERDLPVGDYMIRVDLLNDPGGAEVMARAVVPFVREPGEVIAAIAPATASEAPGRKLQDVEGAVIIRRGDTLWRISRRVYGHGVRYSTIYLANQTQIRDPNRIWPGQVFKVPQRTPEGEAANMEAVAKQATAVLPAQ